MIDVSVPHPRDERPAATKANAKLRTRRALIATMAASATWVGGSTMLDRVERRTIFQIGQSQAEWHRESPSDAQIFDLEHHNGDKVRSWYMPAAGGDAATVLYLHGARWNLHNSLFRINRWREFNVNVLAIDYRGFGASTARLPDEQSVVEDARVALNELAKRQPDASRRFVFGHSLGGAIAIALADSATHADPRVSGLIIESTFTNIPELIANNWGWVPGLGALVRNRFDSLTRVGRIALPMLLIHGTADRFIPHRMSDALFAAAHRAPADLTEVLKIDGGSHSSAGWADPARYQQAIMRFMRRAGAYTIAQIAHEPTARAQ